VRGFDDHHRRAFDRVASAETWRAFDRVHLRFFAGLPLAEVAQLLDISPQTADRPGASVRAWLYQQIQDVPPKGEKKSKKVWRDLARNFAQ